MPKQGEPWGRHLLAQSPPNIKSPSSEIHNWPCFPLAFWLISGAGEWLTFLQVPNPPSESSCHGIRAEGVEVCTRQLGRAVIQHVHQAHRGL